jgi:hypothetical protein
MPAAELSERAEAGIIATVQGHNDGRPLGGAPWQGRHRRSGQEEFVGAQFEVDAELWLMVETVVGCDELGRSYGAFYPGIPTCRGLGAGAGDEASIDPPPSRSIGVAVPYSTSVAHQSRTPSSSRVDDWSRPQCSSRTGVSRRSDTGST